jgi:hypothetical protein
MRVILAEVEIHHKEYKYFLKNYDGHRRFTWSLTSGSVGLVEVHASWPGHPR